ncbi:uncharacterized protein [Montipora foliosa]|uniref:uncharacterized protein isoform X2 n=1 Tax=Montipora foliosa TaxID=591990 RepID=UPI0035F15D7C
MLDTFPHLPDAVASSGAEKEPSLSPRTDAEFSGSDSEGTFLRRKSAADDLVGVFAGSGRIQRRGSRKGKRSSTKEAPRKLNLQLEVVENLLALHLSPPSSVADLPKVLEELQAKKNFCENASTSHDVLPASNNDPMTPITEEVAPEFPSLLVTSSDSENSKDVIPSESALAATNDQVQACVLAESREAMSNSAESKNHKTCPEDETGHSKMKPIDERLIEACKTCSATQGGCGLEESRREDKGRDKEEFRNSDIVQDDVLWNNAGGVGQDLEALEGATSNYAKNDKGSLVENVREIDFYPKGENCITKQCNAVPEVQSPSSCRASSPHSSNKLVDGNNLDGTFERNSLNEGGTIVKLHFEKCPA